MQNKILSRGITWSDRCIQKLSSGGEQRKREQKDHLDTFYINRLILKV